MMVAAAMILFQILLIFELSKTKMAECANALPGCPDNCGGIPIPYPFGVSPNCSMKGFEVTCTSTEGAATPTPFLYNNTKYTNLGIENLLNISLSLGQARVNIPISSNCYNSTTKLGGYGKTWWIESFDTPFWFNYQKNKFTAIGCDTLAYVNFSNGHNYYLGNGHINWYLGGCVSGCASPESLTNGSCSGIGCCQTDIPKETYSISFWFDDKFNNSKVYNFSRCGYAMLVEDAEFNFSTAYITTDELYGQLVPVVLDWAIGNTTCDVAQNNKSSYACKSSNSVCVNSSYGVGYLCNCSRGYKGNPYLKGGCQDIDECTDDNTCSWPGKCHNFQGGYRCSCPFGRRINHDNMGECDLNLALIIGSCAGIVALSFLGFGIYVVLERRNLAKLKDKYFQQHGGWILLEKIKENQGFGFTIFTKQQIEQATNKFDSANIIGQGGQGTVYKGTLNDQMVAIKKCKIVNEREKKEFGKEMLILSQINHKNIVKLLGCCLEVEVPMLVYEFIPNGNLFQYIHRRNQRSHISLTTRLRIAHESAEALTYLHYSASPPIFHGDVKSANILLDQNYMAKVSDFGASILAPIDEDQYVTLVQGTCGYLDPEYMISCQLTNKSDVYSFGVVILELLTSKPVIDFDAPEEERSLSSCFLSAMKEMKMHELLDDQIRRDEDMELIEQVAKLAIECLNVKGEERPTIKEVAEELDRIVKLMQHAWRQNHSEEIETLVGEESNDVEMEHTGCFTLEKKAEESIAAGR